MSAKKVKVSEEPAVQLIYLGPSLQQGRLAQNKIFKDRLPAHLADLFEASPDLHSLVVPVAKLVETQMAIQTKGTPENAVYERLKTKGV